MKLQSMKKEKLNGNYSGCYSRSVIARRSPDLAVQQQLGILPEWWAGTSSADRRNPGVEWQDLTGRSGLFLTLFGMQLNQTLGHDYQTQNLGPFRENVTGHLAPLRSWVGVLVSDDPAQAGD